jgi:deazaflavin-dependent oxidoreductase (nitroreductase family)
MDKPTQPETPKPPRGLSAIPWRLPIWLYRLKLGWLMGNRALLLTHIGRVSGIPRNAVLEVVRFDQEEKIYYVASGFGERADWYQNITKSPEVTIQVGRREIPCTAERLSLDEAAAELEDYAQRHPSAFKGLMRLLGYKVGDSTESIRNLAELIPIIAFKPRNK